MQRENIAFWNIDTPPRRLVKRFVGIGPVASNGNAT
jgi:hypothetical protein